MRFATDLEEPFRLTPTVGALEIAKGGAQGDLPPKVPGASGESTHRLSTMTVHLVSEASVSLVPNGVSNLFAPRAK